MSTQPTKSVPRILVLTPKPSEDGFTFDVEGIGSRLSNYLGVNVQTVSSTDWYGESFARCGGWESWAYETVLGKSFATREANFQGFALVTQQFGRANALIINLALRNSKPVIACVDGLSIGMVTAVTVLDSNNWTAGWGFVSKEL